jgi:hypothetical protein
MESAGAGELLLQDYRKLMAAFPVMLLISLKV